MLPTLQMQAQSVPSPSDVVHKTGQEISKKLVTAQLLPSGALNSHKQSSDTIDLQPLSSPIREIKAVIGIAIVVCAFCKVISWPNASVVFLMTHFIINAIYDTNHSKKAWVLALGLVTLTLAVMTWR